MIKYENGKLEVTEGPNDTLAEFSHLTALLLRHQWWLNPPELRSRRRITEREIKEAFALGLGAHKAREKVEQKWADILNGGEGTVGM